MCHVQPKPNKSATRKTNKKARCLVGKTNKKTNKQTHSFIRSFVAQSRRKVVGFMGKKLRQHMHEKKMTTTTRTTTHQANNTQAQKTGPNHQQQPPATTTRAVNYWSGKPLQIFHPASTEITVVLNWFISHQISWWRKNQTQVVSHHIRRWCLDL